MKCQVLEIFNFKWGLICSLREFGGNLKLNDVLIDSKQQTFIVDGFAMPTFKSYKGYYEADIKLEGSGTPVGTLTKKE